MAKPANSGILTRKYKSGSIIYFENDKSDSIFILKSGKVILTSVKLDTGEEVKEDIKHGEFFGVKSAIGKYPREETAQTVGETVVLVMHLSDFERLVLRNPNVVRKMLRVFSNQLRRIHKMVRSVMGEGDTINPDIELFRIGEFYYNKGVFHQAEHAYKKLMEYYPDSQYADQAMGRIKAINTGQALPGESAFDTNFASSDDSDLSDFQLDDGDGGGESLDFDLDGGTSTDSGSDDLLDFDSDSGSSASGEAHSDLTDEMDSFLSDDSNDFDFSFDEPPGGDSGGSTLLEIYTEAKDLAEKGHSEDALDKLINLLDNFSPKNADEEKALEGAKFYAGKCEMELGNLKPALDNFGTLVKESPNSEFAKNAFYHIGLIFESANQKDKAINYFNKVLNMSPKDDINAQAMNKIQSLQG